MKYRRIFGLVAVAAFGLSAQSANAHTYCGVTVRQIFSGDAGTIWILFVGGGQAMVAGSDPDREATLSLAMTALVGSRPVIVRYVADNVQCNVEARYDMDGFYLN